LKTVLLRTSVAVLGAALTCVVPAAVAQTDVGIAHANAHANIPVNPGQQFEVDGPSVVPHRLTPTGEAPAAGSSGALTPISFHGGPVMGTPKPYLIWYGNWNQANGSDTPAGQTLIREFLYGVNNSAYYQINATYGTPTGQVASTAETTVTAKTGTRLADRDITTIVSNAITSGRLPKDANGVYFVVTSSDIAKTGFCTQYCGWHTVATIGGVRIKYSFVGNANRCLGSCAAQTVSPNGNAGVDGTISVLAHELEEANTDPELNAWYDSSGAENADKCAWTFGQSQSLLSSGAYYNMTLPTSTGAYLNFLVQRNLAASDNKCYVNWITKAQ
jgi:hypothetical protein